MKTKQGWERLKVWMGDELGYRSVYVKGGMTVTDVGGRWMSRMGFYKRAGTAMHELDNA